MDDVSSFFLFFYSAKTQLHNTTYSTTTTSLLWNPHFEMDTLLGETGGKERGLSKRKREKAETIYDLVCQVIMFNFKAKKRARDEGVTVLSFRRGMECVPALSFFLSVTLMMS